MEPALPIKERYKGEIFWTFLKMKIWMIKEKMLMNRIVKDLKKVRGYIK